MNLQRGQISGTRLDASASVGHIFYQFLLLNVLER
jgi:hypothetical protein